MGHPLLELKDKTAVVIGGTSGIGLALTEGLAQAGANVVPTGRRAELVRAAASAVETLGRRSLALTCDVTDNSSLEHLADQPVTLIFRLRQCGGPNIPVCRLLKNLHALRGGRTSSISKKIVLPWGALQWSVGSWKRRLSVRLCNALKSPITCSGSLERTRPPCLCRPNGPGICHA